MGLSLLDFESEPIRQRPAYPPKPVGLAFQLPGQPEHYAAWGHPEGNGIYRLRGKKVVKIEGDPERVAKLAYKDACKGEILGHSLAGFDVDVAETAWGIKPPPWHRVHDSLFTRFLAEPHAPDLRLKSSAERVLGEKPTERDALFDWLVARGWIQKPKMKNGKLTYQKNAGEYICKTPGDLAGLYAIGDLTRSKHLFDHDMKYVKHWGMLEAYKREQRVAPILLANERRGMRVDVKGLERDVPVYKKAQRKVEAWLGKRLRAPASINWDSDAEVADALRKARVVKAFPQTAGGKDSVSKKNLTASYFSDRRVYLALAYRNMLDYILSQSLEPWLEQAHASGGLIYTRWSQVRGEDKGGARSGRITCSKWQNIIKLITGKDPDFTEEGYAEIRKFIGLPELPLARVYCLPDVDDLFVHNDWNQQELRLVAHYEDGALAEAYRNDPSLKNPKAKKVDIHEFVRDLIEKATQRKYLREPVKTINFRTVYGGGATGLAIALRIPYKDAKAMIRDWKIALPDVVELDKELKGRFYEGLHIRTYGGRVYFCKPPTVAKKGPRKGQLIHFEYTALNYLIQPSGADLIKMAIIAYDEHPKRRGRMLNIVHDEMNASAGGSRNKKTRLKVAKAEMLVIKECMESIKLDVPWRTDGDLREAWGGEKVAA